MCISAYYKIYATSKKRHKPTFIHILHTPVSNFSTKKIAGVSSSERHARCYFRGKSLYA